MPLFLPLHTTSVKLNKAALITDIGIHILILWTFLSAFFFLYISRIERNAFENEFGDIIADNVPDILTKLDIQTGGVVKRALQANSGTLNILHKIYDKPDPLVQSYNNWLMLIAFAISLIMFVMIGTGVAIYGSSCKLPKSKQIPLPKIIVKNIITFLLVGMIEALFFLLIAARFTPSQPSQLVNNMISRIKQNVAGS